MQDIFLFIYYVLICCSILHHLRKLETLWFSDIFEMVSKKVPWNTTHSNLVTIFLNVNVSFFCASWNTCGSQQGIIAKFRFKYEVNSSKLTSTFVKSSENLRFSDDFTNVEVSLLKLTSYSKRNLATIPQKTSKTHPR